MKKYRIVTVHHRDTAELMGYWILLWENRKYVCLASKGKPLQFATKKEARKYINENLSDLCGSVVIKSKDKEKDDLPD